MEKIEWQALNVISFLRNLLASFFALFVPIYMLQAHLSPAEVGLAIGLGFAARLLTAPLIGTLNDMLGTRRLLQLSLLGMAAGAVGLGMSNPAHLSLAWLIPAIALLWASNNALIISLEASLYKKSSGEKVARHMGEYNASKALAWGSGVLAGGFLLLLLPFSTLALALAGVPLLSIALTWRIRHTVRVRFDLKDYVRQLRRPIVLLLSLFILIQAFEWGAEGVALPAIYLGQGGLDSAQIGIVSVGANIVLAIAAFWTGRHLASRHRGIQPARMQQVLMLGMLCAGAGCILIFFMHDLVGLMAARAVYNTGEALIGIAFGFLIGNIFSQTHVGGANGVMNLMANASMAFAAFASGALVGIGAGVPYLLAGSFFLIGAVLSMFVMREMK